MPAARSSAPAPPFHAPRYRRLIVLIIAVLALGPPWRSAAAGPPVVRAASGALTSGAPGPSASLPIEVVNVQGLGAATVLVAYDPTTLKASACQNGPRFDIGMCNFSHDRDQDGTPDAVLFNVLSLNGVSSAEPITLVNITWQAITAVTAEQTTSLVVRIQTFTDATGKPLPYTTQDGQITLLPPPPTPTPTATATLTPTATPTQTATTAPKLTATPTATATPRALRIYLPSILRPFGARSSAPSALHEA